MQCLLMFTQYLDYVRMAEFREVLELSNGRNVQASSMLGHFDPFQGNPATCRLVPSFIDDGVRSLAYLAFLDVSLV